MKKAVFLYSPQLEEYPYPPSHPFNTIRVRKVRDIVKSMGLLSGPGRREVAPEPADRIVLKKFHSARYLHALKAASDGHGHSDADALRMGIGSSDCPIFKGMYEYSALACGASLTGARLILEGDADVAFNPSGGLHHAGPERASGFCYLNDVALACIEFAEAVKKVLYLDLDVHHGDGVAYAFYDRSDVMTISFHQNGKTLFPGTGFEDEIGTGKGKGYCVNVPLPVGTYDAAYMEAFRAIAVPLIEAYNPEKIVLQLGADALAGDPLANLSLTNNTHADIISYLLGLNKPILATGGGGYNIDSTVRAWALDWSVLCGADKGGDMNIGLGGVMMGSTDWQGGLRDRALAVSQSQHDMVMPAIAATIETIKMKIFKYHSL